MKELERTGASVSDLKFSERFRYNLEASVSKLADFVSDPKVSASDLGAPVSDVLCCHE